MSDVDISRLQINNYWVCCGFLHKVASGGGVIILARKNIPCSNLSVKCTQNLVTEKRVWRLFSSSKNGPVFICNIILYGSPECKFEEPFNKLEILVGNYLKNTNESVL